MKTVEIPGSKSYTNRALIIAALAKGTTKLNKVLLSDDTILMMAALKQFGVSIQEKGNTIIVNGGTLKNPKKILNAGAAGTTMRFLTSLATLVEGKVTITGNTRMQKRPIQDLLDGLNQLGVNAYSKKNNSCPPVVVEGTLVGGNTQMNGDKSSQYFTSILMCAPYAERDVEIEVIGDLASKPYIDITIDIMKKFGVVVENKDYQKFIVRNGQTYSPCEYNIEGDASNASYFLGAGAVTGEKIRVTNVNPESKQGDIKFSKVLEQMGCSVFYGKDFIEVKGGDLKGIDVDMNHIPDVVQTLGVVALFAKGKTKVRNVPNLRIKETDRINALATELRKLGGKVKEFKDGLEITPGVLKAAEIDTYEDHRMAMSFAIATLKIKGVKIKDPLCVRKSFPDFWVRWAKIQK
ncbi:3-phosphoshikimate 1-carboxyvinyltransferase [Nanoarchaeota archaeon]